jgi:hypothetical protein
MLGGMDYAPDLWHDFAVTVGGLAGALTGLLFVALSIKSECWTSPCARGPRRRWCCS